MLTSLDIKTPQYNSRLKKILSRLLPDTMKVEVRSADGIKLKHIEYVNRSGKVNFKRIDKEVCAQRNRILCDNSVILPKNKGYKRFFSKELEYRLCTNLSIEILRSLNNHNISVGLLDTDAAFSTLVKYLLKYTDNVVVVTDETDIYKDVGEELLNDIGAPIRISKTVRSLQMCDLVIAPKGVPDNCVFKDDTLVFTTERPESTSGASIVYSYRIELDKTLDEVCPDNLSAMYFASALYTMCHMYKLGSLLPQLCVSENKVHTLSSLKVLVQNIADKTLT